MNNWDVAVIGGGAAGLSAALMLGRARRRVLVIDSGSPRNRFADHMHGVLGSEGVDPAELVARGRAEVSDYGVEFLGGTVVRVDEAVDGVSVVTAEDLTVRARAVIVATGITDRLPDVPGLAERWGKTVLHCPYCHGWEVRDQRLGMLATSPFSLHQAELVRQWSDRITLFTADLGPLDPAVEKRLRSRGVELVAQPVVEVVGQGDRVAGIRVADGDVVELDAIFTFGPPEPHDRFLAHLDLDRTDGPMGSFLTVDVMGKTSGDRIWAAGNVVNPGANVPMAISAGAMAGAAVNMALVTAEFDTAVGAAATEPASLAEYWEARYSETERVWSGRANRVLVDVVGDLPAGTALELGCGEGADAIWLAARGWQVTAVDISPTAIDRARAAAAQTGIPAGSIRFVATDLSALAGDGAGDAVDDAVPGGPYDLVTASFLHSWPFEIPRTDILRRAARLLAPGGNLLITSHAGAPPWADPELVHKHRFLTPAEEIEALDLDPDGWEVTIAEVRGRETTGPDGQPAVLDDGVVMVRRR